MPQPPVTVEALLVLVAAVGGDHRRAPDLDVTGDADHGRCRWSPVGDDPQIHADGQPDRPALRLPLSGFAVIWLAASVMP